MSVWLVTVVVPMCVEASTEAEAIALAAKHVHEEGENCDDRHVTAVEELTSANGLPFGWAGSIPYGADDDRTVRQRVESKP